MSYKIKEEIEEKIRYPMFSCRLSEKTIKLLKDNKIKSGKSWNLFIYQLLNKK